MKSKTKSSKKTAKGTGSNQPFTISIHGDGIDIDARIAGGDGGSGKKGKKSGPSAFEQFFEQLAVRFGGVGGKATDGPLAETINALGSSLTETQIEILTRTFTTEQLGLFDQIMSFAGLENQPESVTKEALRTFVNGIAQFTANDLDGIINIITAERARRTTVPPPPQATDPEAPSADQVS